MPCTSCSASDLARQSRVKAGRNNGHRVQRAMQTHLRGLMFAVVSAIALVFAADRPGAQQAAGQQTPTFRGTTDLIARDSRTQQFIANLKPGEVSIYEDGVKQELASFVLTHGGRVVNLLAPPPAPAQPGIILPQRRPSSDTGRIFLIVIDDFHLQARDTPRTRDWLKRTLRSLIHDGDMFGIVSTGHSSISEQLTYDRQVLESAIERVTGSGLTPREIIEGAQTSQ